MKKNEFVHIRQLLEKTQKEMAQLLGVSIRTVQSFEQGLRKVPLYIERQSLLLLALKQSHANRNRPCWTTMKCPAKIRKNCPAWEFSAGHFCWFINGTLCRGKVQKSWRKKMEICSHCKVFKSLFTSEKKLQS